MASISSIKIMDGAVRCAFVNKFLMFSSDAPDIKAPKQMKIVSKSLLIG